jgi:hypothetical protein
MRWMLKIDRDLLSSVHVNSLRTNVARGLTSETQRTHIKHSLVSKSVLITKACGFRPTSRQLSHTRSVEFEPLLYPPDITDRQCRRSRLPAISLVVIFAIALYKLQVPQDIMSYVVECESFVPYRVCMICG